MIGDAYFQLRAQIGTSLFSLAKLARDLEAPESALVSLQELQSGLREPFLFVTLGESGAGKSSLLNALFGREFTGDSGASTVIFRHQPESRDVPLAPGLIEGERPHIFLRDFTIIDVAGLGTAGASPEILQRFLPQADVLLFVFAPEEDAAVAWDFLDRADRELLRRCVFLVQKADAVEGEALMSAVLNLHDRLRKTFDEHRPIFAVSAHKRAGFEKLERYLDAEIIGSPVRFQKLREICSAADDLLFQLGARTRTTSESAESKLKLAEEQRAAIDASKDEALRMLDRDLWSLTQIFEAALRRGEELLRRRIDQQTLWKKRPLDWRESFQREVEERVREGVVRNVQLAAEHCDQTLRGAWKSQCERMRACGAEIPGAFPDDCSEHVAALESGIEQSDPEGVTMDSVFGRLTGTMPLYRIPAFAFAGAAVLLVLAWCLGHLVALLLVLLVLTFAATALAPMMLRDNLVSVLRTAMARRREGILARVELEMRSEIERVFAQLHASLDAMAASGAKEREDAQPMLSRILQLAELFDTSIDEIESYQTRPPAAESAAGGTAEK